MIHGKNKLIVGKWRKDKHKVNDETNKRMAIIRIWAVICPVSYLNFKKNLSFLLESISSPCRYSDIQQSMKALSMFLYFVE
jgi:hypothetical protein